MDMDENTFYNRANFFLAAQAIFANAFATLAISDNLLGFYRFLPITTCVIGIFLNIAWIYSGFIEVRTLERSLKVTLKDIIYKVAPVLLFIAWTTLLVFFTLQTFGIVKVPFLN